MSSMCLETSRRSYNISAAERRGSFWLGVLLSDQITQAWNKISFKGCSMWTEEGHHVRVFLCLMLEPKEYMKDCCLQVYLSVCSYIIPTCLSCRAQFLLVEEPVNHKAKAWRNWKNSVFNRTGLDFHCATPVLMMKNRLKFVVSYLDLMPFHSTLSLYIFISIHFGGVASGIQCLPEK